MERVLFSSIAFAAVRFQGPGIWIDWKIFDNGICFLEASMNRKNQKLVSSMNH